MTAPARLHGGLKIRLVVAPAQRSKALRMQIAAQTTQLLQRPRGGGKGQHNALHVHHRLGKARLHQHVAPVVHIGKSVAARPQAQVVVQGLQLAQRVGSQAREH